MQLTSCPARRRTSSTLPCVSTSTRTATRSTPGIKAALGQLNGTDAAAVSLMTGLSAEELDDLGGLPK